MVSLYKNSIVNDIKLMKHETVKEIIQVADHCLNLMLKCLQLVMDVRSVLVVPWFR